MTFLKRRVFWIIVAVFLVAGVASFKIFGSSEGEYELTKVKRGDIAQEVGVTGRVKPAESVDLAFEKSGRVAKIMVAVGDEVKAGQVLASLSNNDLAAQVAQAQASYEKALAQHQELLAGTRPEELQIARTKVANAEKVLADSQANLSNVRAKAQVDLDNLYDDVKDVLTDAYLKADDALNKQIDDLFYGDTTASPALTFDVDNYSIKADTELKRRTAGNELAAFKSELDALPVSQAALDAALASGETRLKNILGFFDKLSETLNRTLNLSAATLADYKYDSNTGRSNINAAITNLNSQKQSIAAQKATNQSNISTAEAGANSSQNALTSAKDDLLLKEAGATAQQVAASAAGVKYAKANVDSYQAEFSKTIIVAPFDGVITKQDAKAGQTVTLNASLISLMSRSQFQMEANVAEADIAKIKVGDRARVTLDTYGSQVVFWAKVAKIDPAETIIEGVATYKATFQFDQEDERIMSGMTANIDIVSQEVKGVLMLPSRAVFQENGKKFVLAKSDGFQKKEVMTGLKGVSGDIEMLAGVKEGDGVILSPEKYLEKKEK